MKPSFASRVTWAPRRAAWLVCAAMPIACSLVTDFDKLTGDANGSSWPSGSSSSSSSSSSGGAADAQADGDMVGPFDADSATGFCSAISATRLIFCDDFDGPSRTTMAQGGWTGLLNLPGAVLTLEYATSRPRAARFRYGIDGEPGRAGNATSLALPEGENAIRVHAAVRAQAGQSGAVMAFAYGAARPCVLEYRPSVQQVTESCNGGSSFVSFSGAPFLPVETFTQAAFTLSRRSATAFRFEVRLGSSDAFAADIPDGDAGALGSVAVTVVLGNINNDFAGIVDYDDVWVELL